jgi:hypothetical protein
MSIFALILLGAIPNSHAFTIVRDGEPQAMVYIARDAKKAAMLAARELREYVEKISGAKLEIVHSLPADRPVIYVGDSEHVRRMGIGVDELPIEGYRIISDKDRLVLVGRDGDRDYVPACRGGKCRHLPCSLGTARAVYRLLEDVFGVRWYMPGELGEVVPKQSTMSTPDLDITDHPWLGLRRTRIIPHPRHDGKLYGQYSTGKKTVPWLARAGYGGGPDGAVQFWHTFQLLSKYRDTNPEFFALLENGDRDFDTTCFRRGNLCLSNPGTVDAMAKEADLHFETFPNDRSFAVSPNDCMYQICRCEPCQNWIKPELRGLPYRELTPDQRRGVYSDYVWTFVNKVARKVREKHPDKLITSYCYQNYVYVPQSIEKMEPNVGIVFCKMLLYSSEDALQRIYANMREWRTKLSGPLYASDYYVWIWRSMGKVPKLRGFPVAIPHRIACDVAVLKDVCDGQAIYGAMSLLSPGLMHLNFYVTGKLMCDPATDVDELLDEYYVAFYGAAASEMKAFWELSERGVSRDVSTSKSFAETMKAWFPAEELRTYFSLLAAGRDKTPSGSREHRRLALIESEMTEAKDFLEREDAPLSMKRSTPVSIPPEIDGRAHVGDSVWKSIPHHRFLALQGGSRNAIGTYMKVAHDDRCLYISIRNVEGHMAKLKTDIRERDGRNIWKDDCNEIFLQPDSKKSNFYHLVVNAAGVLWDGVHSAEKTGGAFSTSTDWDSDAEWAVGRHAKNWTLEMAIPWASLSVKPRPGMQIKANVYRRRCAHPTLGPIVTAWSPLTPFAEKHLTPSRFGSIHFDEEF